MMKPPPELIPTHREFQLARSLEMNYDTPGHHSVPRTVKSAPIFPAAQSVTKTFETEAWHNGFPLPELHYGFIMLETRS